MNGDHLDDLLESLEIPVTLAHPRRTRAIAEAKVKPDKVDSTILAHLLRTDLIPAAYIPPCAAPTLRSGPESSWKSVYPVTSPNAKPERPCTKPPVAAPSATRTSESGLFT